jgi:C-terminal processing protease CtpA/Prc
MGLVLVCSLEAQAEDSRLLVKKADAAYSRKDYATSAELYRAAFNAGPQFPWLFHNAVRAAALAGPTDVSFDLLGRAIGAGVYDAAGMEDDPDLENLRTDVRWRPLLARAAAATRSRKLWSSPALATPYRELLPENERIAGLSQLWSEVKLNFANFDLVPDVDWDALYLAYLPRVRQARSTLEYYRVLMECVAKLKDGHTNVFPPGELRDEMLARPALSTGLVEGRVVVTRVQDDSLAAAGLVVGVEVVAVDGIPVRIYGEERVAPYQSASTPQDLEARTYTYSLLAGPAAAPVKLTLRTASGKPIELTVPRMPGVEADKLPAAPPIELRMLPRKVAYVAINTFADSAAEQFEARFDELSRASALVLDVRNNGGGNGNVAYRVLQTLAGKPFLATRWRTREYHPAFRAFGLSEGTFELAADEMPPAGSRRFDKPVVVLTSARTFSAAEDFVVAFDAMRRGKIVGEPTGGSSGSPLFFSLPGGGAGRVCTKRDTYPDGKEFIGVGVVPDVLVRPTLADVRSGRDTVLERALEVLRQAPP